MLPALVPVGDGAVDIRKTFITQVGLFDRIFGIGVRTAAGECGVFGRRRNGLGRRWRNVFDRLSRR